MCRIGRRLRSRYASICGAAVEIRPFDYLSSNPRLRGHCLVGSLTGVVASKSVTEASKGALRPIGNRPLECNGIRALDWEGDIPSRQETGA